MNETTDKSLTTTTDQPGFDGKNARPFDLAKQSIDDLFEEASSWLDGAEIASDAEAAGVEKLLDMARDARKGADEARKVENEPFDTGKADVQARYNPILKRADIIADGCREALKPWREKIAAQKAEVARLAREEADRKAAAAQEAIRESAGNVVAREQAEVLLKDAKKAERVAVKTTKNADTGLGLRTSWQAEMTDLNLAVRHYWSDHKGAFAAVVQELADKDARAGARDIPGFNVKEVKSAI